ncbi:unnamed protein product [Vitrella brassicaformis CCMP3155]|uniref:Uncharacterized protein n=1 Tax=Vitrella brassicaformis (strain CCMP3155) TaxID=1169540 RepID=A0A0G4ESA0_VITBC|nr:unnamed protein product [Vitrella brassicaformis CCMP3155]|eukprot:CEM01500.1 unnamed protein product [Vitrella brassicaformis CCMP3155]
MHGHWGVKFPGSSSGSPTEDCELLTATFLSSQHFSPRMSLKTDALPQHFPHFAAWYGQTPSFLSWADPLAPLPSCMDEWRTWYYGIGSALHVWRMKHANTDLRQVVAESTEQLMLCIKMRNMSAHERPMAMRERHVLRFPKVNDVWTYRQPPPMPAQVLM